MNTRLIVISIVIAAIAGSWFDGYQHAQTKFEQQILDLKVKFMERQDELKAELRKKQQQRKVIYRDRIKVVEKATGGCLDAPVPDGIMRAIRGSDNRP